MGSKPRKDLNHSLFSKMKISALIAAASAAKTCKWTTYCTDITAETEVTNSWTCKDCFNVRVQADLNHVADGNWFSAKDAIYVGFDEAVDFIKAAGPVDSVSAWPEEGVATNGQYIYEIKFISNHEFGDKRIDSNIGPCGSDPTKEDPCLTSEAPLKKYPSKQCRSKRKGKKLTCKALCNGGAKASPNTVTSCYRESNNKPIGQWDFRKNNKGSC